MNEIDFIDFLTNIGYNFYGDDELYSYITHKGNVYYSIRLKDDVHVNVFIFDKKIEHIFNYFDNYTEYQFDTFYSMIEYLKNNKFYDIEKYRSIVINNILN
jgi:hypothetical protein